MAVFALRLGAEPFDCFHGYASQWKQEVRMYETQVRPALNMIKETLKNGSAFEVKVAINAAVKAGASRNDIVKAVGGIRQWNKLVRRIKKAGLV